MNARFDIVDQVLIANLADAHARVWAGVCHDDPAEVLAHGEKLIQFQNRTGVTMLSERWIREQMARASQMPQNCFEVVLEG